MKLENYETYKSDITTDLYTFQYNPRVYTSNVEKFVDERDYAYAFTYFGVTNPLKAKRPIVLNGHFSGTNKNTNYRDLVTQMKDNKIKKLFFSDDKFYIVIPRNIQETRTGERVNFIDYVANFISPFGLAFSSTQKDGDNTSINENEGDVFSPFETISGNVTLGSLVTIKDKDDNGFTFTPTASGVFKFRLVYFRSFGDDNFMTEYLFGYVEDGASIIPQRIKIADSSKRLMLGLNAGQTIANLFTGGVVTNITDIDFEFRDAYSGE